MTFREVLVLLAADEELSDRERRKAREEIAALDRQLADGALLEPVNPGVAACALWGTPRERLRRAARHLQGGDTRYFSDASRLEAINLLFRLADEVTGRGGQARDE